jgi:ribonucleoside-diphosphate reductase alpha chain
MTELANNDTLRKDLLTQRYLLPGESEQEFYQRIATFVTQGDLAGRKDEVYELLESGQIIFNSPLLMNAGAPAKTPLSSACYVLPVEDDINSIMKLQNLSAKIFKLGAGVGVDYSLLRKEGAKVGSGGTASGPVSFMTLIDQLAEVIKSGGKRRAAIMSSLRVDHEDILKFIKCKRNDDFLLNTNISVMMTDDFMKKVVDKRLNTTEKEIWDELVYNAWLRGDPGIVFIDTINNETNGVAGVPYTAVNACVTGDTMILTDIGNVPIKSVVGKKINIWNGHEWSEVTPRITGYNKKVIRFTFSTGEVLTCTDYHTMYVYDPYENSVIPVPAENVLIGDIMTRCTFDITGDVVSYEPHDGVYADRYTYSTIVNVEEAGCADTVYCVNEPKRHMAVFNNILTGNCSEFSLLPYESCLIGSINVRKVNTYAKLKQVSNLMVRCLDNIIDYAWYPSEEIKQAALYYRRVGVGITGLSEWLIDRSIRYGSQAACDATIALLTGLDDGAYEATTQLAEEKSPCPAIKDGKFIIDARREDTDKDSTLRRNITTTTIAPTGSTSILLGVDGTGCEPLFSFVFSRVVKYANDTWYTISASILQDVFKKYQIELTPERLEEIKKNNGSVQGLSWVPEHVQSFMVTAQDLEPMDHVRMLSAAQNCIEANISKTINLPNEATEEDVEQVYIEAWKRSCKCVTVFRDGCKSTQVLVATKEKQSDQIQIIKNKDIPVMLDAKRIKISTPSGSMYVMLSFLNGKPIEVFANLGKSGGDDYAYTEALGRVMSLALKYGVPSSKIIQTLRGIKGKDVALFNDEYIYSVPDAIAAAIHYILEENHLTPQLEHGIINHPCPQCGVELVQDNGCEYCKSCGWSNCS